MPCFWRIDLQLLLMLAVFLVAECVSTGVEGLVTSSNSTQQMDKDKSNLGLQMDKEENSSKPLTEEMPPGVVERAWPHRPVLQIDAVVITHDGYYRCQVVPPDGNFHHDYHIPVVGNSSRPVLVDTKAVLYCPPVPLTDVIVTTWKIILRNKPPCLRAHRTATHMTTKTHCTDERMTWPYRPDQNSVLQIDPVVITHDGYYECQVVTPDGNFHYGYHLQVLVVPEMTLFKNKNRTAVCKAIAGRPAARISWTPEGDCVPEHNSWDNGTVTVQSTCHWADSNVSVVSCSISHETGNWSQSLDLNQGTNSSKTSNIIYIILSIFTLVFVGSICLLKIINCRKCKWKKTEPTPVTEEDEMQPYASYTEKNNPLYDTTDRVKTFQVLQSEVDGMNLHIL